MLSYSTHGAGFQATIAENLIHLLACRMDPARFVKHAAAGDVMPRHYAAGK